MSFLRQSKYDVRLRGLEYYKANRVLSCNKIDANIVEGQVKGSDNKIYNVKLNLKKPKMSTCTCPYVKDNHKICKHMMALYFKVNPIDIEEFDEEINYMEAKKEEENQKKHAYITSYLNKCTKETLKKIVYDMLMEKEGWVIHQCIEDYGY